MQDTDVRALVEQMVEDMLKGKSLQTSSDSISSYAASGGQNNRLEKAPESTDGGQMLPDITQIDLRKQLLVKKAEGQGGISGHESQRLPPDWESEEQEQGIKQRLCSVCGQIMPLLRMRYWLISRSDMRLAASRCSGGQRLGSSRRETSSSPSAARSRARFCSKPFRVMEKACSRFMQSFSASRSRALTAADFFCSTSTSCWSVCSSSSRKIQIFRKNPPYVSPFPCSSMLGGDLTGVHGIETVLDLLTERLYLVTGGRSGSVERSARSAGAPGPCMPAGLPCKTGSDRSSAGRPRRPFWGREEEYRPTSPKGENPPRSIRNSMEMSPFADAQQIWSGTLSGDLGERTAGKIEGGIRDGCGYPSKAPDQYTVNVVRKI